MYFYVSAWIQIVLKGMDIIPTSAKEFVMQISVNNFLQHFSNLLPCDNFGDRKIQVSKWIRNYMSTFRKAVKISLNSYWNSRLLGFKSILWFKEDWLGFERTFPHVLSSTSYGHICAAIIWQAKNRKEFSDKRWMFLSNGLLLNLN